MTRRPAIRRLALITVVVTGGVTLLWLLFDPFPFVLDALHTARIRRELPSAMERWRSHMMAGYQIDVRGAVPLVCLIDGELTVEGDQLVGARMRQNVFAPSAPLLSVEPSEWDLPGCAYRDLTVDRMFERVQHDLEGAGILGLPLVVSFDQQAGFVTDYRIGRSSQGGLLGSVASECCTWFQFRNFRPTLP